MNTTEKRQQGYQALVADGATKGVAVYVPFGGQRVNLGDEAQTPTPENPLLQYATGLPATRPKMNSEGMALYDEETGEELVDSVNYTGFFTACGVDKELDERMKALDVPTITIQHQGGAVQHWMLSKVVCFLLAKGIPSNAASEGRYGVVYLWRNKKDNKKDSEKRESVLYVQVMIRPLLPHYKKPFVFTVRGTQTTDALAAFSRQYKVLNRAHEELQRHGEDMSLPLSAYSLTLKASTKQDVRGKGIESRRIYPIISLISDVLSVEYLQRHEMPLEHADLLRESTENAVDWAKALSQRIASGAESHEPWQSEQSGAESGPF